MYLISRSGFGHQHGTSAVYLYWVDATKILCQHGHYSVCAKIVRGDDTVGRVERIGLSNSRYSMNFNRYED